MRWNTGERRQMSMNGCARTLPADHGTDTHGYTSPVAEMAQLPRAQLQLNVAAGGGGRRPTGSNVRSGPRHSDSSCRWSMRVARLPDVPSWRAVTVRSIEYGCPPAVAPAIIASASCAFWRITMNFSRTAMPTARSRSIPAHVRVNEPTTCVTPS